MSEILQVPPHSELADLSVLGALMLENTAWVKVQGHLEPVDFYQRKHQVLFSALSRLLSEGRPADVITVHDFLKSKGHDETVGGLSYLIMLAKDTPSAANIAAYMQIVKDKSVLRQLLAVGNKLRELAYATDSEAKDAIGQAETAIFDVSHRHLRGKKGFTRLRDVLIDVLSRVEENYDKPATGVLGVSSGLASLDALTSGFVGGNLIVLAARPAMGKTALAMNMAESAALTGMPVAVFSMEMQAHELGERLLSSASGVGLKSIRESWTIQDNEWPLLTTGIKRLKQRARLTRSVAELAVSRSYQDKFTSNNSNITEKILNRIVIIDKEIPFHIHNS